MLQQTQVVTVIPYWERWMARFPTVQALAAADEQDVLSIWQGLGYYRRCRLLLKGARQVAAAEIPKTAAGWLEVPGIGRYTAGAIASIAFDFPSPVVDGNVERVYARLVGDSSPGSELKGAAWKWAERHLYRKRPGDWNQALMELGATLCKPIAPDCRSCPLSKQCVAFQSWRVGDFPSKPPKVKTVRLRQAVWVPVFEGKFGVRQIPAGQWWEGMWEFPRAVADGALEPEVLRELTGGGWPESVGVVKHSVTHHRITIEVSFVRCDSPTAGLRWLSAEEMLPIAMPAPQRKILKLVLAQLGYS
jgi:A/G-specific adenine glycosylase